MREGSGVLLRRVSPDGALIWLVQRYQDEQGEFDFAFGFESGNSGWHSHPDMLDAPGKSREQVVSEVTDDVTNDRMLIKATVRGDWVEHALLGDLETEVDYLVDVDDQISIRFWSGRSVSFDELIDGAVAYRPFKG